MNIKKYVSVLEAHRKDLELSKSNLYDFATLVDVFDALDFAIDSLKAVDEWIEGTKDDEEENDE